MFKLTVVVCYNVYQVFPRGPLVINGKLFLAPYMSHLCVQNKRIPLSNMQTIILTQEADFFLRLREKLLLFCSNQALEIRGYLKSCGADINEESMSPLHEDLEQLLMACDINFKSEAGMCLKFLIISTYL